tara:strand:- start:506 stop:1660 length:1155 start_codon:yes stop_codon:yes gene_type:complete
MFQKPLLIIGIDPGTTVAYACIDTNSTPIKIDSQKQLDYSSLIKKLIGLGKPLIIATDKARIPDFVEKIAIKTGSRIIAPEQDLLKSEKKELVKNLKTRDAHQFDALAAALFAYSKLTPTLTKIEEFVKENKKEKLHTKMIGLVIKEEVNLKSALYLLEHRDTQTTIVNKVVKNKEISKKDFLMLYDKIKDLEKDIHLLKKQNTHLQVQSQNIKTKKVVLDPKLKLTIDFKEQRILHLTKRIEALEENITSHNKDIDEFYSFLANVKNNVLVKKLKDLGSKEYEAKKDKLNIIENDILLVDNPNIISNQIIKQLEDKIYYCITKTPPSKKITAETDIIFLNAKDLDIKELKDFALITKNSLEKAVKNKSIVSKVIEQYKKSRQV